MGKKKKNAGLFWADGIRHFEFSSPLSLRICMSRLDTWGRSGITLHEVSSKVELFPSDNRCDFKIFWKLPRNKSIAAKGYLEQIPDGLTFIKGSFRRENWLVWLLGEDLWYQWIVRPFGSVRDLMDNDVRLFKRLKEHFEATESYEED